MMGVFELGPAASKPVFATGPEKLAMDECLRVNESPGNELIARNEVDAIELIDGFQFLNDWVRHVSLSLS